jgi:hypothetical protein
MKEIYVLDKNFKVDTKIVRQDIVFYNVLETPFEINGVFYENGKFRRMPEKVAKSVSEGVYALHTNTAGGRVRFKTDSSYIAINTKMGIVGKMSHFALTGSAGFDLYVTVEGKERYFKSFIPPFDIDNGYESVIDFETSENREITINFPLYSDICELYIGVSEKATIDSPSTYKYQIPIVYYGSSITQGGCASRPGNSYQAIISREFRCDYINLGFSGNAKAEKEIIEYIKELKMSVFVYDYDHNAPNQEHLRKTHELMYKEVRNSNPNLPIILMSRPKLFLNEEEKVRFEIIKTTYLNAKNNGDHNVYFIPGYELMKIASNEGTVDDCHPNDLGFYSMGNIISNFLKDNNVLVHNLT